MYALLHLMVWVLAEIKKDMLIPSNEEGFYLEYDIGDRCDNFSQETPGRLRAFAFVFVFAGMKSLEIFDTSLFPKWVLFDR